MENLELANTSTKFSKKKKSKLYSDKKHANHGGSSDQETFLEVKPRRSFWKNLFRKTPKKTEIPEMSDQNSGMVSTRLNAIFEEPKTPEEKDHAVSDEIEEIKKTLKKISPSPPPSVLMAGIELPPLISPEPPKDDPILDYLSDDSSSSESSQISEVKQQVVELSQPTLILDSVENFLDSRDPVNENSLLKEGYSFEYESEDNSMTEELSEKTQDKVKFDEKVEQKDADSNIVVKDLNIGNEAIVIPEDEVNSPPIAETIHDDDTEEKTKNAEEVVTGSKDSGQKGTVQLSVNIVAEKTKKTTDDRFNGFLASGSSPSLFIKPVVFNLPAYHQNEPVTIKQTLSIENFEELELWSQKLNDELTVQDNGVQVGNKSFVLPSMTNATTTIDINTEQGLDDFFKLIFNQRQPEVVNYTVAYDPVFDSFNIQGYQSTLLGENVNHFRNNSSYSMHNGMGSDNKTNLGEEKQKVVRKRKMMSLLHDKNKMAEYLKQIENEENKTRNQQQTETVETINNNENCASLLNTPKNSAPDLSINNNLKETDNEEKILFLLENTKEKLQEYVKSNIVSYPDNYLEIYRLIANNGSKSSENINKNSTSSINSESSISITESRSKKFHNIDREIENIFEELLLNINEMKEICISNGAKYDAKDDLEPIIAAQTSIKCEHQIIESILNDILENVVEICDDKSCNTLEISFEQSLLNTEGFLNALKEEVVEYNPVPFIKNIQTNSVGTSSVLINNSLRETAESLLQTIEDNLNKDIIDKSKRFGPYKDRKPGESQSKLNNNYFRSLDLLPEVTNSLQHIFFGESSGEIQSEFNLVPENISKPGTSKDLSSKISLYKLPSVPSTDLYITGDSLKFASQNALVETLMEKRFSGLTGSSLQVELSPELVQFRNASVSSEFQPNRSYELERKRQETNLANFENYGDINKSIEENMKIFQEKMNKIDKLNAKTVEMLATSNFSTPEGSLSILSTITENMLEITSKNSKMSQERYPQFISASNISINTQNQPENNSKNI